MTDQTVPVPVDLLKRLMDNVTIIRDVFDGDSAEVRPSGIGAIIDLKSLIPSPPKVGDTLTAAGVKAAALPERSVLIDSDGDAWITSRKGSVYLSEYGANDESSPSPVYEPYLLVHIGRD